jgi:hypothetical protein
VQFELTHEQAPYRKARANPLYALDDLKCYTRLTNAHIKKFENHCHMVALYTLWYNFARINSAVRMSPAMSAGISIPPLEHGRHREVD